MIKAKKSLGQNFLKDMTVIDKIIEASGADEATDVIEIGPGKGAVTEPLVNIAKSLTAVEIDDRLYDYLEKKFASFENFRLVKQDILKTDISSLITDNTIIVANLPYYITTPIITSLIESRYKLKSMTVMVQLEVAKRICADEKSKDYGALSVLCNYFCDTKIVTEVSPECFEPVPKVKSAVVRMDFLPSPRVSPIDEKMFFKIVKAAFSSRRKTFANCLMNSFSLTRSEAEEILNSCDIPLMARGETFSLENFKKISDFMVKSKKS